MTVSLDSLKSLDISLLESFLSSHPATREAVQALDAGDERESQRQLMARKRAAVRDIKIPPPANPDRRAACLADAELFFRTYSPDLFGEKFTSDRSAMLEAIIAATLYGGDQAIAGPRGEGKTTIAIRAALWLMLRRLCDFPCIIGKSQAKSQNELKDLKEWLQTSELFIEDFPEIGVPFKQVGGWSSRARMQTVCGKNTSLVLAVDHLIFPTIAADQLTDWPKSIMPVSEGQTIACLGIDGPIRGTKYRGKRPKLAIIDDVEDREAAASDTLIAKIEEIIEQDIAGLGASAERVSRVMLCTTQNRKCIAYKYTDPKQKPSWRGKRYRKMITPPERQDLIEQYIAMRKERSDADPDGREAYQFWLANMPEIERGAVVSNPESYSKKIHEDGQPIESSAVMAYYNRVADWGPKAVATEVDNDPPAETGPVGNGITADIIGSRISGLARRQLPANTIAVTAAIDLGKYLCHWVICAWWKGAGGVVVDYGRAEVAGTDNTTDNEASEPMIYKALLRWRDEMLAQPLVDATGQARPIDFVLVDSGTFTNAAYEFVKQVGGQFHASKGIGNYRPRTTASATCIPGERLHAQFLPPSKIWLYDLDADYWKQFVHERFLTPTFDDNNMLRAGSLSLFHPDSGKKHLTFANHIASEELVTEFKEGKGAKTYWNRINANNHWLDALAMASAGTEVCKVNLIGGSAESIAPRQIDGDAPKQPKPQKPKPHGRFRTRPGGWIPQRRY